MKILFKYPSRGRVDRFFDGLDSIYNNIADKNNFHVACTLDVDDLAMNNEEIGNRIRAYGNISIQWGLSESKVHAINRDMPDIDFDIIVCMSDDMRYNIYGFDEMIRLEMPKSLDYLLHFWDTDTKGALATMYIAGINWFNKRNRLIYRPEYKSLFCDNEEEEVAKILDKHKLIHYSIYAHLNPAYGHLEKDEMFNRQQETGWSIDQQTYVARKINNFGL